MACAHMEGSRRIPVVVFNEKWMRAQMTLLATTASTICIFAREPYWFSRRAYFKINWSIIHSSDTRPNKSVLLQANVNSNEKVSCGQFYARTHVPLERTLEPITIFNWILNAKWMNFQKTSTDVERDFVVDHFNCVLSVQPAALCCLLLFILKEI